MGEQGIGFSHMDSKGRLRMVDVSGKDVTERVARAEGEIELAHETLKKITEGSMPKGNVFEAARIAGIMAAKRTWELIPLCHSIQLAVVEVSFVADLERCRIGIRSMVKTADRTGVEMEALVAVVHAALTIYDMCKAVDRGMKILDVRLTHKSGGRSGIYEGA